jgi:hypothetical protein
MGPRLLRYAKREELALALRYGRLYRRITDATRGGTYLAGEDFVLPDRAPIYKREVSTVCPVHVVSREHPLDLRNFYETVDGIWCPDSGCCWPAIFEFFVWGGEALVENELDNMVYPEPAVVLFPE